MFTHPYRKKLAQKRNTGKHSMLKQHTHAHTHTHTHTHTHIELHAEMKV